MNLGKIKITNKGLYWGLIITFAILYVFVGFVSTLHSIAFFHLANSMGLAILLGLTYELGQASVLFGLLMTKNKDKFLPWALMILLTALQVTANVYASFRFMVTSGTNDWQYWQKSILFGVQASSSEMYQVIISWISGALLPVIALGMTALVAENIKMMSDNNKLEEEKTENKKLDDNNNSINDQAEPIDIDQDRLKKGLDIKTNEIVEDFPAKIETIEKPVDLTPKIETNPAQLEDILENEVKRRLEEIQKASSASIPEINIIPETKVVNAEISETPVTITDEKPTVDSIKISKEVKEDLENNIEKELKKTEDGEKVLETIKDTKKPITKVRGWHLKKEYEDSNGDIYEYGKFSRKKKKPAKSKKV